LGHELKLQGQPTFLIQLLSNLGLATCPVQCALVPCYSKEGSATMGKLYIQEIV